LPHDHAEYPILVTYDTANHIHFWDANLGPNQKPYVIPIGTNVERYQFTPEGRYLIVGGHNAILVFRLPVDRKLDAWKIKQSEPNPSAASDGSNDMTRWQGKWKCVGEKSRKAAWTPDELKAAGKIMEVNGNRLVIERTLGGTLGRYTGTFRLDPATSPR
jgi:hypothetical protein